MYAVIQNSGEVDFNKLRLVGFSTKRGVNDKIGQFGTGWKQSIALLLRNGVAPVLWSGKNKITFSVENDEIVYNMPDGNKVPSSIHIGFGALDWVDPWYAFRDLISNAMDEPDCGYFQSSLPRDGDEGKTKIVIPLDNPDILKGWQSVPANFLEDKTKTYWIEEECRIFKQGVFVLKWPNQVPIGYSYNLNKLKLNESRSADVYEISQEIEKIIKNNATPVGYYKHLLDRKTGPNTCYEFSIYIYGIGQNFKEALIQAHGPNVVVCKQIDVSIINKLLNRGKFPIYIENWYDAIVNTFPELDYQKYLVVGIDDQEWEESPKDLDINNFIKLIHKAYFRNNDIPCIKWFKNNPVLKGFVKDGVICLNSDYAGLTIDFAYTVIEELSHYYSGYTDCSRDFQEFLIRTLSNIKVQKILLDIQGE